MTNGGQPMNVFFPFAAETLGVVVRVNPRFLPDQSDPQQRRYAWSYHVRIENRSPSPVQLTDRHWVITDGNGEVEEVRGPGVVGQTPVLEPGQSYDYVSGCGLTTPSGSMHGSFRMLAGKVPFDAAIPKFGLLSPPPRAARK